jgi:hypothetical protein
MIVANERYSQDISFLEATFPPKQKKTVWNPGIYTEDSNLQNKEPSIHAVSRND